MVYENDSMFMAEIFGLTKSITTRMTDEERQCWNVIMENVQDRRCCIGKITMKPKA